ncbi:MAG: glucosyltransferase domain-containing protein, partial [Oscillospiraceae bacterium]|nr:glucosyltransferase domain-containing protein [Oscillospiraceae bacterium]
MDAKTQQREPTLLEREFARLGAGYGAWRLPFLSAFLTGLLAHGFAFANKLLIPDELGSLFSKGATVESGRWGLELLRLVLPDISMSWLYGLLSLLALAVTACLTVRLFQIRSKPMQCLLPAVMVSVPSVTALFGYMFTSFPFALALLLAVLSVCAGSRGGRNAWLAGCLLLVLSLSIYQAYIAVAASFFLLLMIRRLLMDEDAVGDVLRFG